MRGLVGVCVVLGAVVTGALGQGAAATVAPSGSVTGRVTFAETQLPARFAEVVVVRKPDAEDLALDPNRPISGIIPRPEKKPQKVVSVSGRSGLDGAYTIDDVPPGDYFAIAKMPGYVVPMGKATDYKGLADISALTAQLAVVHVDANRVSSVDLTLRRGGVISGRVTFQDGSPVVGVQVWTAPAEEEDWARPMMYLPLSQALQVGSNSYDGMGRYQGTTDDDGRYRIAGLQSGKYIVKTTVVTAGGTRMVGNAFGLGGAPTKGGGQTTVTVYRPSAMRKKDAKTVEIRGDERVGDMDIEVNLSGLHTVRGRVMAKEDRHVPTNAYVSLAEEGEKQPGRYTQVGEDGSFEIEYLPPGTYTLRVNAQDYKSPSQEEIEAAQKDQLSLSRQVLMQKEVRRYGQVKVPVMVAEHDVVLDDFLLVEAKGKDEGDDVP